MEFALSLALAFLAGILVKAVDWLEDDLLSRNPIRFVFAAVYGAIIGYLISASSFSMIFLGAIVAQVFARKVDTQSHTLGFFVAAISLLIFGLPQLDISLFALFFVLAFLDEIDFVGWLRPLTEYRPFLKLGSLIPAIWGAWGYFLGIIIFDIGYELFAFVGKGASRAKKARAQGERKP